MNSLKSNKDDRLSLISGISSECDDVPYYICYIAKEVGYLSEEAFQELNSRAERIAGMVGSLMRAMRRSRK